MTIEIPLGNEIESGLLEILPELEEFPNPRMAESVLVAFDSVT